MEKCAKQAQKWLKKCDFGQIRVVERDGEPWFVAADVCNVLDLSNPTIAVSRLDEDERAKFNLGRQGDVTIVNEPGLYTLVLGSRKPEAKVFKRWITHEVIPIIRKTGAYSTRKPDSYMIDELKKEWDVTCVPHTQQANIACC